MLEAFIVENVAGIVLILWVLGAVAVIAAIIYDYSGIN